MMGFVDKDIWEKKNAKNLSKSCLRPPTATGLELDYLQGPLATQTINALK